MGIVDHQGVLKGLMVQDAMRRQVIRLDQQASLADAVRATIKYKVNAVLVNDAAGEGVGVVSKTDLMGAYYADLPLDTPVTAVMVGPPVFCSATDSLDDALDRMREHRIHRLYVEGDQPRRAAGVLAYPDIVGLLYRFCNQCERNLRRQGGGGTALADRFTLREVMTPGVYTHREDDSLIQVMEGLAAHRFGAVPLANQEGVTVGVVSKTDLIAAYLHGLPAAGPARDIMSAPVQACDQEETLASALHTMIFADIHRLFVYKQDPRHLVGVFSLSDAARIRSGTCRACVVSRIKIG